MSQSGPQANFNSSFRKETILIFAHAESLPDFRKQYHPVNSKHTFLPPFKEENCPPYNSDLFLVVGKKFVFHLFAKYLPH